jgi:capsular polysaccharide biosynthesis protein
VLGKIPSPALVVTVTTALDESAVKPCVFVNALIAFLIAVAAVVVVDVSHVTKVYSHNVIAVPL